MLSLLYLIAFKVFTWLTSVTGHRMRVAFEISAVESSVDAFAFEILFRIGFVTIKEIDYINI